MSKFIGFATPRSGTAWLSNFLTYGDYSFCRHEALFGCESLTDYEDSIDRIAAPVKGSIDTAAPFLAEKMYGRFKDTHKFFVVIRDFDEVERSLVNIKLDASMLEYSFDSLAEMIEQCPWIPIIGYDRLFDNETLIGLWKYLEIPAPFPLQRLEMLREILVEDGLSKGFGRFASKDACSLASIGFKKMMKESNPYHIHKSRIVN